MSWKTFFRGATGGAVSSNLYTNPEEAAHDAKQFADIAKTGDIGVIEERLFECKDGSLTDSPTLIQRIRGK